jgi:DNA protecting protein DprA
MKGYNEYPDSLLRLNKPPRWLFVKGNLAALHSPGIIAIIGTREASTEGSRIAYALAKEMVNSNLVVLSGLAKGIDSGAHEGAIDYYGQTIAVLGHGFKSTYGASNKDLWPSIIERDGAIVSEYFIYDSPSRETFLRRNEIQAALSNVVIPVECPDLSSGTGATIRRALAIGTPVAGVFWETLSKNGLSLTRKNLLSLNIPVFVLPNQSNMFWDFIKSDTKNHEWSFINPNNRQERFRRIHENKLLEQMKHASFDAESISKWAITLQERIRKDD